MGVTEQRGDVCGGVRAHQPIGPAMLETHILQPVEIAQQLLPFRRDVGFAQKVVEMLLHRKGQERTEHVATDGGVGRMENRPRPHDRFCAQEEIFDLQQIAIAEHGLQRRHFRVGPEHEDSVETGLFGELSSVDLERPLVLGFADLAQIPSIGRVADERFVAFLQLRVERGDDRLAILAVLFSLCFIAADDITLAFDLHLLDEELRLARLALDEQRRKIEGKRYIVCRRRDLNDLPGLVFEI